MSVFFHKCRVGIYELQIRILLEIQFVENKYLFRYDHCFILVIMYFIVTNIMIILCYISD